MLNPFSENIYLDLIDDQYLFILMIYCQFNNLRFSTNFPVQYLNICIASLSKRQQGQPSNSFGMKMKSIQNKSQKILISNTMDKLDKLDNNHKQKETMYCLHISSKTVSFKI